MLNLPDTFIEKYQKLLGKEKAAALFESMNQETKKAYRINSLKAHQKVSYSNAQAVPFIPNAYYGEVKCEDPEWVSGTVYSQDPAAMFPAYLAQIEPGQKVLDLCAAPGGKTTALGEALQNAGLLVANEISSVRVKALRENLERWGISNDLITNDDSFALAKVFPEFFDVILVDAPCSGEGMFRKNPDAVSYWSPDYVLTCRKRQQEILTEAVKMLRPGGKLVYSTCTFSPEEDEEIVAWLVKTFQMTIEPTQVESKKISHGQARFVDDNLPELDRTLRLWPQDDLGEGQFVAVLRMPGESSPIDSKKEKKKKKKKRSALLNKDERDWVEKVLSNFNLPDFLTDWQSKALVSHDHVFIPAYKQSTKGLKVINNGVELGLLKKKRFEPGHQLAEVLAQVDQTQVVELQSNEEYRKYLHGETIRVKSELRGFVLVAYHDFIFSFGKITGNGVLKNFYPKGLRTMKGE